MSYFMTEDYAVLKGVISAHLEHNTTIETCFHKFRQLHENVYAQMEASGMDLVANQINDEEAIAFDSIRAVNKGNVIRVAYLRPKEKAVIVERLMGREETASPQTVNSSLHPFIEMRMTHSHFVVELLMSPAAWWDQQNFVGKFGIRRHQEAFFQTLRELDEGYVLGYWAGTHLGDMHLKTPHFHRTHIVSEWLRTFEPGKEWLRLGIWYEPQSFLLHENRIESEILKQIKALYEIYDLLLWSSNNNYRDFYTDRLNIS